MMSGDVPGGASRGTDDATRALDVQPARHVPVLLREVTEALAPQDNDLIIDGTFGAGGYTRAILSSAKCRVIAFDRDLTAVNAAASIVQEFAPRLTLINQPFSEMEPLARDAVSVGDGAFVDGVVLDIGVSSMQIDSPERGFSFQSDGPLDMRMSRTGPSAADFINTAEEAQIANVIYTYGEEHRSRAIAKAIVRARTDAPIMTTLELVRVVAKVFHGRKIDGKNPATRTFQALRIYVNDELGELARGLSAAERILKPGGRLVVVTFHSLEDRIVKRFLTSRGGKTPGGSRHAPEQSIKSEAFSFQIVNSKPLTPSQGELDVNPRARSARLRCAVRTDAPSWPLDFDAIEVPQPDL